MVRAAALQLETWRGLISIPYPDAGSQGIYLKHKMGIVQEFNTIIARIIKSHPDAAIDNVKRLANTGDEQFIQAASVELDQLYCTLGALWPSLKGTPAHDAEQLVADYIKEEISKGREVKTITRDGIAHATKIAAGSVSQTTAWKNLATQKNLATAKNSGIDAAITNADWQSVADQQVREAKRRR